MNNNKAVFFHMFCYEPNISHYKQPNGMVMSQLHSNGVSGTFTYDNIEKYIEMFMWQQ